MLSSNEYNKEKSNNGSETYIVRKDVPLAPLTTLRVGGSARFFIDVHSNEEVISALSYARKRGVGVAVLGRGSNLLVPDKGVDGLVIHLAIPGVELVEEGDETLLVAGAGVAWNSVVDTATSVNLWGVENLAGIPSSVGAAPVQNIGAYGAELANVFAWAEAVDKKTGEIVRINKSDVSFGYRQSTFKQESKWVVVRVALRLSKIGEPNFAYKDLSGVNERDTPLKTPKEISHAVRKIRASKMPPANIGSSGSFFKNPVLSTEKYEALRERFPELPGFETSKGIKVPLAWVLDNVLGLKGLTLGRVRLHEKQPLVLTTLPGATSADVDACVREVFARVKEATGIEVERETETFFAK